VIEHVVDPAGLLTALRRLAKRAVAVLVSTPERVLVRGAEDLGPPANSAHVREWSLRELVALLGAAGLSPTFKGLTANNSRDRMKRTSLAIIEPPAARTIQSAPADFQATAVMTAFNEADIVAPAICALLDQGVDVHLVDNWSTDGTADAARALGTGDRLTVESFPPDGPSDTYDWELLLCNVETIAHRRGGWILHQDVDELRRTPWPDISLRDGLWHVERRGYNAVDFTSLTFVPIDDNYRPGEDFEAYFRHFEFGARPGHFVQIKAWNADAGRADLASSGGHEAAFPGRRVFPWKFLSKHYPIRSQAHGERKVFAERVPRWNPDERTRGWHVQYDAVAPGSGFLRDHADLIEWHQDFHEVYLTERLTGIGVNRSAS
jgi:glycosyltransferase involved in cell wall biosynthesis